VCRGALVKLIRCCLIVALLGLSSTAAFADAATDPKIIHGGGGSCQSFSENSLTQSFHITTLGCAVDFTNNINSGDPAVTLTMLVVNVTSAFSGALTCDITTSLGTVPLSGHTVSSPTSCTFSAQEGDPGIPFHTTYSLNFDTKFGSFVDVTLAQFVIPAPEPATMLLLGTGLAALLLGRKRVKVAGAAV
jgi:hypothetical protein